MGEQNERGIKEMFKQVYDMWERSATEQLEKFARSQAFLTAIAQNMEQNLNITGRVKDITQTTLNMMNLPTKSDVAALSKQVKAMRAAVDEINEKLDKMARSANRAKSSKAASKPAAKRSKSGS